MTTRDPPHYKKAKRRRSTSASSTAPRRLQADVRASFCCTEQRVCDQHADKHASRRILGGLPISAG